MYCVIQQVMRKKPDPYGEYREIEAYQNEWRIAGDERPCTWAWRYTGGRYERPHLEAYKISIHHSFREGGAVRKHQYSIRTMSYYDIVEYSLYDCANGSIHAVAGQLGMDPAELYKIIETKLEPLRERLETDFQQSAEYQAKQEHRRVLDIHNKARTAFSKRYDVDRDEYDRCYDVFGQLRNPEYLKQIKAEHKARKQSERSYRQSQRSSYREYRYSSYSVPSSSTYSDDDRAVLKKFYRELSKIYHPDLNPGVDTTAQMQVLNRLKEQWGV